MNVVYNTDCLQALRELESNSFDLAIVDPPYGGNDAIGRSNTSTHKATRKNYELFENQPPPLEYFQELYRVAKRWVIWGGNFFGIKGTGVIVWDKGGTAFGEAEIAICNTHSSCRIYRYTWNGMIQQDMRNKEQRIHPTQKPVGLYFYILDNYAKPGDRILDTHLGSGSSRIAADMLGYDFTGYEISPKFYADQERRYREYKSQLTLL